MVGNGNKTHNLPFPFLVCNDRDYCITYPIATSLLSRRVQNRGSPVDAQMQKSEDRHVPLY
jgi:hypothetical protein